MHTALKSLVIGLGVLILLGLGLLAYGLAKKSNDPDWRLFGAAKTAAPPASSTTAGSTTGLRPGAAMPTPAPGPMARVSGDVKLNLAEGCEVRGVNAAGGMLYVLTGPASVCGEVLIVDPAAGKVVGRLTP